MVDLRYLQDCHGHGHDWRQWTAEGSEVIASTMMTPVSRRFSNYSARIVSSLTRELQTTQRGVSRSRLYPHSVVPQPVSSTFIIDRIRVRVWERAYCLRGGDRPCWRLQFLRGSTGGHAIGICVTFLFSLICGLSSTLRMFASSSSIVACVLCFILSFSRPTVKDAIHGNRDNEQCARLGFNTRGPISELPRQTCLPRVFFFFSILLSFFSG